VGGYYRLNEVGFKLAAGAHVLPRAEFAPVEEATRLLAEAEAKAAEIVKQAEEAFQREKQRGYEEGRAQAQLESVERLMAEQQVLNRGLERVEQDLAKLVSECVRRIIDGFDEHARAEGIVRGALKQMRREKRVELRAPPGLHDFLRSRIDAIRKDFPEIDLIDVVEDPLLEPEQVIVETSIGRVDGNLSQRLDDLETVIRGAYSKATADAVAARATGAHAEAQ
jgi:type III secretion protein L